jgi:UDP-N-acetylglucosamine--N-acetylmuramyl-(pentapeptide) pyrophosphoryl-undecaprenol N-acetylglucosamine transferase
MKVIIAGGGTGGHLFPAVALGEEMMRERPGIEVLFVGTSAGIEAKWLPKSGYSYELFEMHGIRGHNIVERARASLEFVRAIALALSLVRRFRPDLVVSAGGYASASMGAAAIITRTPLVLMEQNTRPGLVNRMLSKFADKICVGFGDSVAYFGAAKVAVTGNPTRFKYQPDRSGREPGRLQILVLGGSSGAHRLNIGVVEAFKIYGKSVINLNVVHQTGEADEELVRTAYRDTAVAAVVVPFIDDIAPALHRADLVIARSGAMTVTDIALSARAAILVPYPFHRDMQQLHNARVIEKRGGAIIVLDDERLAPNLARELDALIGNPARLDEMGVRAHQEAHPDAARNIARICFDVARVEKAAA